MKNDLLSAKVTDRVKMFLRINLYFTIILLFAQGVSAQMTMSVVSTPQLTPLLDDIYIAGSFNEWNPGDPQYKLILNDGVLSVNIPGSDNESVAFKFTRGNWATVEGNTEGAYIENRSITWVDGAVAEFTIAGWEDIAGNHSTTENVRILDSDMLIPQLNRTRRIWIKLPEGYDNSEDYYPVIYMHDGQNLFDAASSFAGEWTIDEITDELIEGNCSQAIIVGIENGGASRIDEYSPWYNADYEEGGEGAQYAEFIVQTLKPLIESQFRARTERAYNFTGGSSLGALIAAYIIFAHQDEFGGAILFSPAFWFNPEIQDMAANAGVSSDTRFYFACGNNESESMLPEIQQMISSLENSGIPNTHIESYVQAGGQHNEYWWAQYFENAYEFALGCTTQISETDSKLAFHIFPNPVKENLHIDIKQHSHYTLSIYDRQGKMMMSEKWNPGQNVDVSHLPRGIYSVELMHHAQHEKQSAKHTEKMIKY